MASVLVFFGCDSNEKKETKTIEETEKTEVVNQQKDPFHVELDLKQEDDNTYNFIAKVKLDSGAYIISPYSTDDTFLHFNILFQENDHISTIDSLIETPISTAEYEELLEQEVRYVRQTTTYEKKFERTDYEDFEMEGSIEFLVEPRCSVEEIRFTIKCISDTMYIESNKLIPNKLTQE